MLGRLSLANKCLILFGLAVVLIIVAALSVPWLRMNAMVDDAEAETSRRLVDAWERMARRAPAPAVTASTSLTLEPSGLVGPLAPETGGVGAPVSPTSPASPPLGTAIPLRPEQRALADNAILNVLLPQQALDQGRSDAFVREAWAAFQSDPAKGEHLRASWFFASRDYDYARAVRDDAGNLQGIITLRRTNTSAGGSMWLNTIFLLAAGLVALGLAVLVFYLITTRLILSPVRALRDTAEAVQQGNLDTRSDIHTGDEFEDLAEAFNLMVQDLAERQRQLRAINASLEEKANQLAERNVELFEAARVKDEFLASVTHELRTPMNSVLGFAELLDEQVAKDEQAVREWMAHLAAGGTGTGGAGTASANGAGADAPRDAAPPIDSQRLAKRRRFIENILSEGRRLLELINGLLEMAKMEAGKAQVKVRPVDLRTLAETQLALMRPMADKRGVDLRLESEGELPTIFTDAGKLQQVLFNLLSNAVKFTADAADEARAGAMAREALDASTAFAPPRPALVILRVEHLLPSAPPEMQRVRLSVLDTGPGIASADQKRIFEKFTQLDSGITRRHAGTGLGLYICKQLTTLLQGEIMVESEIGRGAMFSVVLPVAISPPGAIGPPAAAGDARALAAGARSGA